MGNPLRFKLTAGNKSDTPELIGLVQGLPGQQLLADKACDSDAIVQEAIAKGMEGGHSTQGQSQRKTDV